VRCAEVAFVILDQVIVGPSNSLPIAALGRDITSNLCLGSRSLGIFLLLGYLGADVNPAAVKLFADREKLVARFFFVYRMADPSHRSKVNPERVFFEPLGEPVVSLRKVSGRPALDF
jgi:hypothetical protein